MSPTFLLSTSRSSLVHIPSAAFRAVPSWSVAKSSQSSKHSCKWVPHDAAQDPTVICTAARHSRSGSSALHHATVGQGAGTFRRLPSKSLSHIRLQLGSRCFVTFVLTVSLLRNVSLVPVSESVRWVSHEVRSSVCGVPLQGCPGRTSISFHHILTALRRTTCRSRSPSFCRRVLWRRKL